MNLDDLRINAEAAEGLLKAMASQPRLMILCELLDGEHTVTELHEAIGLSMSAVSQHLARLREENIVATRRESQTIWYTLEGQAVETLLHALHDIYCAPTKGARRSNSRQRISE